MLNAPSKRRRITNTLLLVVAIVVSLLIFRVIDESLANPAEWSGWTLVVSCLVLLGYAGRKRLSTLPLGRVAHWLQLHIYLGTYCLFVFAMHLDWRLPNGWFEVGLAISFIGTVLTGLLGLYWSRTLPTELTRLGDEVIYERIHGFSDNIRQSAEREMLKAAEADGSHAISDFYQSYGHAYFSKPHFHWIKLFRNYYPHLKVGQALETARKFMDSEELKFADELAILIKQKGLLDAHYTWQGALKHWLFIHLAFSLSLVPLVLLHIILAYSFALN